MPLKKPRTGIKESNTSRFITQANSVVESANAGLKSWKYIDTLPPNTLIPFVRENISIAAALCNKYLSALSTENDDDEAFGCKMFHLSRLNNDLQLQVEIDHVDKIKVRMLSIEVYQVGIAKSYAQEHSNEKLRIRSYGRPNRSTFDVRKTTKSCFV